MDQKSSRSLSRKVADRDLVAIDEKLECLHDDVANEKRAQRIAGRVSGHPVDDAKADESGPDVARQNLCLDRNGEAESREHRGGEDK